VWNVDEFSAVDYTLNIVSKCRFFCIFKHSQAPNKSWKIFHRGPGKSWIFVSKRAGTLFVKSLEFRNGCGFKEFFKQSWEFFGLQEINSEHL